MKRNLLKILLVLCGVLAVYDFYMIYNHNRPATKHHASTAIVRLTLKGNTFCTGTVVNPTTVLTAAHCVVEQSLFGESSLRTGINVRPPNNADLGVVARVTAVRYQMDQAILTGDFSQFDNLEYIPDVKTLDSQNTKGHKMTACGYALGGRLFCTTIYFKDMENFMWRVHGTLIPGMSGGPVLLDNQVVATNCAVNGPDSLVAPIYNLDLSIEE